MGAGMDLILIILAGVFSVVVDSPAETLHWNQYMGPNQTGKVEGIGVFPGENVGLKVRWQRRLGSGYSHLVTDKFRLFAMYRKERGPLPPCLCKPWRQGY